MIKVATYQVNGRLAIIKRSNKSKYDNDFAWEEARCVLYSHLRSWLYSLYRYKSFRLEDTTRQSKHCGFSIYIFDNSKSIMKKVKINGQVGQGEEDGRVWSGLC